MEGRKERKQNIKVWRNGEKELESKTERRREKYVRQMDGERNM